MRVLVVDDEPPARERLVRLMAELGVGEIVGEASNGREALSLCEVQKPDVLLLDIRMPVMDGIEAARHLTALDQPPAVIFTTAYDEYALDAFEAQAIGYLLKPVRKERPHRALRQAARLGVEQLDRLSDGPTRRSHIGIRVRDQLRLVPVDQIIYFRAEQKYVTVKHRAGDDLLDEPLKSLADEFADTFMRVHRSTLVAVRYIEALERDRDSGYRIQLKHCDDSLPVSRRHVAAVRKRIKSA